MLRICPSLPLKIVLTTSGFHRVKEMQFGNDDLSLDLSSEEYLTDHAVKRDNISLKSH